MKGCVFRVLCKIDMNMKRLDNLSSFDEKKLVIL